MIPPPPLPPTSRTGGDHGPGRQGAPPKGGLVGMGPTTARSPPPPPNDNGPGPPATYPRPPTTCHQPFLPMARRPRGRGREQGEGAGMRPRPPRSPGTGDGTMASPFCAGDTAKPPWCSPPPPTPGMGHHRLCLGPLRGAVPRGPAPPGPRGLERVVAHPPAARGQPGQAVRHHARRRPRVRDQGGHCRPSPIVEVRPGPLRARPPA